MWFPCATINDFAFSRWQVNRDGEIRQTNTHKSVKGRDITGYVQMVYSYKENDRKKQKTIVQHNLILETFKPRPLDGIECDHRDGNRASNSLKNLRWLTHPLNELYKPSKGYSRHGTKWQVHLGREALGTFEHEEDAKVAYLIAKSRLIVEQSEELLARLVTGLNYERSAAISALNWTEADLDFDSIFQFCVEQ